MKKKKIKYFIKENYLYLLFLIPIILFLLKNRRPDNDIWFLLNSGRYVLNNGFTTIEPFTIHEGLNFIMNQWLSALLFYLLFHYLTKYTLYFFIILIGIISMIMYYKLCYLVSNNKKLSIVITSICFSLIYTYIVTRPQIFTYLILIIELYLLEKYIKCNNIKYLYYLPFLSLLLINLHGVMWIMQFAFMLPFIINSFKIKNITIDSYKLKPLMIVCLLCILIGFINPYGYKTMIAIFNSYGSSIVNTTVVEMLSPTISSKNGKIVFAIILLCIFITNYLKKCKLDIRHYCLISGTLLLFLMHNKGFPYFIIASCYSIAYSLNKFKYKVHFKKIFLLFKRLFIVGLIFLIPTFVYCVIGTVSNVRYESKNKEIVDYLLNNYDVNNIRLYVEYSVGGYTEYMGIKSFADPRAEVFMESFNGKEDIINEIFEVDDYTDEEFEEFINKYKFTHFLVFADSGFDKYLSKNYKLLKEQEEVDNGVSHVYFRLYSIEKSN